VHYQFYIVACNCRILLFQKLFLAAISNYGRSVLGGNAIQGQFDSMQSRLHCCGSDTFQDWFEVPWYPPGASALSSGDRVGMPDSCCDQAVVDESGSGECVTTTIVTDTGPLMPYSLGCAEAFTKFVR
jgi:hypothetical protein